MVEYSTPQWLLDWYDAKEEAEEVAAKVEAGELPQEALIWARRRIEDTGGGYDEPPSGPVDPTTSTGDLGSIGDFLSGLGESVSNTVGGFVDGLFGDSSEPSSAPQNLEAYGGGNGEKPVFDYPTDNPFTRQDLFDGKERTFSRGPNVYPGKEIAMPDDTPEISDPRYKSTYSNPNNYGSENQMPEQMKTNMQPGNFMGNVKGMFDSIGFGSNYNVQSKMAQAIQNPLTFGGAGNLMKGIGQLESSRGRSGTGAQIAAGVMPMVAGALGAPALGIGLLGGMFNSMGAHRDWDETLDSDLYVDLDTGISAFQSMKENDVGGYQEGFLNNANMLGEMDPRTSIQTSEGWAQAGPLSNYMHSLIDNDIKDPYADVDGVVATDYFSGTNFSGETPFGNQAWYDNGQGNFTSNNQAVQQLNAGIGPAYNEHMSKYQGYNEGQEALPAAAQALENQIWHSENFGGNNDVGLFADYDSGVSSYSGESGNTSGSDYGDLDTGIGGDDDWDF